MLGLITFVERVGLTPTVVQATFAKLIPEHKAKNVEQVSMRSIGLMPSLYRQWARLRQGAARA